MTGSDEANGRREDQSMQSATILSSPSPIEADAVSRPVVMRLMISALGAILFMAAVTALLIVALHRPQWWSGWTVALAVSLPAALLSLIPVASGLSAGLRTAAYGYLAGAVIRVLLTLAGLLVAIIGAKVPPVPTVILVAPLYLAQLVVEIAVLGQAVRSRVKRH